MSSTLHHPDSLAAPTPDSPAPHDLLQAITALRQECDELEPEGVREPPAALEQSLREAQRLGHEHLGVEHLLLALLRDEDGGAVRALGDVGVSTDDLERCLGKVLKEASFSPR